MQTEVKTSNLIWDGEMVRKPIDKYSDHNSPC